jgi:hypothetical protein
MLEAVETERRHRAILEEIAALGPVVPGSITERMTRCQTVGCRCHADPPQLHGPYFAWTHRSGGRQVSQAITPERAEELRPLLLADRRLHELIHELEALGADEATEVNTVGSTPGEGGAQA